MPRKPKTRAQTHTPPPRTHRRTGGELIYAAVYCHYHQTSESESEQEPGSVSPLWSPIVIVWVSGVYRAVTSQEAQQTSRPPRPSLIAYPAPLPAPPACYFHHFYEFVSLLCLYRFPPPPHFSCIYMSELNFRPVLLPRPYSCLLLRHRHSGNSPNLCLQICLFFLGCLAGVFLRRGCGAA